MHPSFCKHRPFQFDDPEVDNMAPDKYHVASAHPCIQKYLRHIHRGGAHTHTLVASREFLSLQSSGIMLIPFNAAEVINICHAISDRPLSELHMMFR